MKHAAFASILLLASCAGTRSLAEAAPTPEYRGSRIELHVGVRALDEGDWSPVEDQTTVGLEFVHEGRDAAIGFEVAGFVSEESEDDVSAAATTIDVTGKTAELSAGVRRTFLKGEGRFHPYVGGGLAAIQAKFRGEAATGGAASDDDTSPGVYAHGGLDFDLAPAIVIGLDLRFLVGSEITLFGVDADADYAQLALVLAVRL